MLRKQYRYAMKRLSESLNHTLVMKPMIWGCLYPF